MQHAQPRGNRIATALCRAALAVAIATCLPMGTAIAQTAETTATYNIPAGDLATALDRFSTQSGLQLLYRPELVAGKRSPPVSGTLAAPAVLERLLKGSGLTWTRANERTYVLKKASDPPKTPVSKPEQRTEAGETKEEVTELETIIVTGTNIRGIQDLTAPVSVYTSDDIDRSGVGTTQEFIRTLPQNFKGGTLGGSEEGVINSANGINNVESASGVNLRGLGNSATLVLLNGHRVAPSALGSIVDVSSFPLPAIEQIEILTDGASSIYGSDAVGGVANFVLRKDYNGAETGIRAGTVTGGNRTDYQIDQTLGRSWASGNLLGVVQYAYADALPSSARSFTATIPQPTDLYPESRKLAALLTGRQELGPTIGVFADVLYNRGSTERSITDPTQSRLQSTDTDFLSFSGGARWRPFGDWQVEATGLFSQVETDVSNIFAVPRPPYVNGEPYSISDFDLSEWNLKADGSLFQLPGGTVKVAIGGSTRREEFSQSAPWASIQQIKNRSVESGFAELFFPLVGKANAIPFVERLNLSASIRYDDYSDFGNTTNPKYGLFWEPFDGLAFRASYGTSFRAPNVQEQIGNAANLLAFNFPFAAPGGGTTPVLILAGTPILRPETSRNISAGAEYRPKSVPGLRLSINYFDIHFQDRLISPPFDTSALLKPDIYGPLITQFADDAAVEAYVANLAAQGFDFFDFIGTGLTGIRYGYTIGLTNAASVRESGFDVGIEYQFSVNQNEFLLQANGTFLNEIATGFCASCNATDLVNTYGQPLQFKMRTAGNWTRGPWQANIAVNYANSYDNTLVTPATRIDSYTTVDLNVRYAPPSMRGLTIGLNAINLLDANPPETTRGFGYANLRYDSANADALGRVVSLQVRKQW